MSALARSCLLLLLMLDLACTQPRSARARIDSVPIIVTYELKKQRRALRAALRDPKAFWVRQIVARINDKKLELAKPLKQPAVVRVSFVVGRDGKLLSKAVAKSSGSSEADNKAIALLEGAQPFPPMPDGLSDGQMAFDLPVRFR